MSIFLLSPANCSGQRVSMLRRPDAGFELARELRSSRGAELGAVFAFASSLYFRGKLAYAQAFARAPRGVSGVLVMAPGWGLVPADTRISSAQLEEIASVPVDETVPAYAVPLRRDSAWLARSVPRAMPIVLLGSVASTKYTSILLESLGGRLLFPASFVGRGDMSRGGLLLRSARDGAELAYAPVQGAVLRGVRPPRLPKLPRMTSQR